MPIINNLLELPFRLKIATKDWHPPDHISFAANHAAPNNQPFTSTATVQNPDNPSETFEARLWPNHCVQGSPGAELLEELDIGKLDHIVEKGQDSRVEMYSAFTSPFRRPAIGTSSLARILKDAGISHVFIVGLAMDYCVKHTAIDSKKAGFVTYVVREATRAVDPEDAGWGATEKEFDSCGVNMVSLDGEELDRVRNGI